MLKRLSYLDSFWVDLAELRVCLSVGGRLGACVILPPEFVND
jgi:hypothetical protein